MAEAAGAHLLQAIPHSVAVLRPQNAILAATFERIGLQVVYCHENQQGIQQTMADSLTTAIRHLDEVDSYVIALADMPYIQPATILEVSSALQTRTSIVVPTYRTQRGHPVGFSAKYRNDLLALQGDQGARSIIQRYAHEVTFLATEDVGILKDIDTPADLI